MKEHPKILVFGTGAIGATVSAWVAPHYSEFYVYDLPQVTKILHEKGLTTYQDGRRNEAQNCRIKTIDDLSQITPDVIMIAVKTYSLEAVCSQLKNQYGDNPIIIALQNGVENQKILPKFFSKIIYGVVSYNAWIDEPGVIGYQKKGPIVLGTLRNDLQPELLQIATILNRGFEVITTDRLQDAAHCKMVINLTNSFTTLVGHRFQKISDPVLFQKLLTNLTAEGVKIVKAAGIKECKLGGMPSWTTMCLASKLPTFVTRPIFNKNLKKMVVSSMAQDILQRKGSQSELDALNGHIIHLADQYGVKAPYNRAIYELCKERFNSANFQPMDVKEVWARVESQINS